MTTDEKLEEIRQTLKRLSSSVEWHGRMLASILKRLGLDEELAETVRNGPRHEASRGSHPPLDMGPDGG